MPDMIRMTLSSDFCRSRVCLVNEPHTSDTFSLQKNSFFNYSMLYYVKFTDNPPRLGGVFYEKDILEFIDCNLSFELRCS